MLHRAGIESLLFFLAWKAMSSTYMEKKGRNNSGNVLFSSHFSLTGILKSWTFKG